MTNKSLEDELFEEAMRDTNGNISKAARQLGLNFYALREMKRSPMIASFPRPTTKEPFNIQTLGKPGLERYVIAVKPRGESWPTKYKDIIAEARKKFDSGTHDMYQCNNGGWVVQYLIPLMYPRKATRFFADMVIMS